MARVWCNWWGCTSQANNGGKYCRKHQAEMERLEKQDRAAVIDKHTENRARYERRHQNGQKAEAE